MSRSRLRRNVRALRRRLESFDPDERIDAGAALVKLGLTRRTATALRRYLKQEEDARVRFSIALAVARTNGGRSRRRRVRQLRRWTVEELVGHGHPVHQRLEEQRGRQRPVLSWRAPAVQS
jgi:HEAT repeat protein